MVREVFKTLFYRGHTYTILNDGMVLECNHILGLPEEVQEYVKNFWGEYKFSQERNQWELVRLLSFEAIENYHTLERRERLMKDLFSQTGVWENLPAYSVWEGKSTIPSQL